MHNIQNKLFVNVFKTIKRIYERKSPTNEQIKRCKRYGKEMEILIYQ